MGNKVVGPKSVYWSPYIVKAEVIVFDQVEVQCNPNGESMCGITFEATDNVNMISSTITASMIKFIGDKSFFGMDGESKLVVTGMAYKYGSNTGKGYDTNMGASYAGQGGTDSENPSDLTYGNFFQVPNNQNMHNYQMGSGGGSDDKRGGGVIVIQVRHASINGQILANGAPSATKVSKTFNAGSGGYIFISCLGPAPCNIKNYIRANGGYGSDDRQSNSGSGGRLVFNNVHFDNDERYSAYGGCSNNPTSSVYNGAAGTIYFNNTGHLVIRHNTRCIASGRTVIRLDISNF